MNSEQKLEAIQTLLNKYRVKIDKGMEDDCEVTIAGNGINAYEADGVLRAIEKDINKIIKKRVKPEKFETWIISAHSESGDEYPPKKYDHKPTKQDKRDYILHETPEEINIGGPGDFGSYVHLEIHKV